ncbi:HAD-IIA family hydrolase [Magnetospira sp. QH-2]|uniref:HAD-IIA family hydrolase n=1 Tax=Magnetospira sp. (strain QH-2) TaxID=1288970 RepID=UPI0003E81A30|nr:HAD hydrolase-like protein [Magnetospira sp. QH-2]CCQ73532.1 HAD-superfamily hydrolase, subfamily IIA [Magnetospira sp. QH-2]
MIAIEFPTAWQTYLAARAWYPDFPDPVTPEPVSGVLEAVERSSAQVVLLDAYGVLHQGGPGFPWARAAFHQLRCRNLELLLLTNDASGDKQAIAERNGSRGFLVSPSEIVAGVDLLPDLLKERPLHWGVAGSWGNPFAHLMTQPTQLGESPNLWDRVEGILLLDTDTWTAGLQRNLAQTMRVNPRPLVVCNPDVACPYEGGAVSGEPGYFLYQACPDADITFLGKPFPGVYDRAAALFPHIPRSRFLAVGDSPHTDVLGARAAGMKALMVQTGFTAGQDPVALFEQSGIWPDYIAPRL